MAQDIEEQGPKTAKHEQILEVSKGQSSAEARSRFAMTGAGVEERPIVGTSVREKNIGPPPLHILHHPRIKSVDRVYRTYAYKGLRVNLGRLC